MVMRLAAPAAEQQASPIRRASANDMTMTMTMIDDDQHRPSEPIVDVSDRPFTAEVRNSICIITGIAGQYVTSHTLHRTREHDNIVVIIISIIIMFIDKARPVSFEGRAGP